MKDSMSTNKEEVRGSTLKSETGFTIDELMDDDGNLLLDLEEAHYFHTINAFVELIVLYGWDTVMGDLKTTMREKQW